jgi:hypothetical protein
MNDLAALYIEVMDFPEIKNDFPVIRPPKCPSPSLIKKEEPEKKPEELKPKEIEGPKAVC